MPMAFIGKHHLDMGNKGSFGHIHGRLYLKIGDSYHAPISISETQSVKCFS
jgi:hypothetical protein